MQVASCAEIVAVVDLGACARVTAVHAYAVCSIHISTGTQMSDAWSEMVLINKSSALDRQYIHQLQ